MYQYIRIHDAFLLVKRFELAEIFGGILKGLFVSPVLVDFDRIFKGLIVLQSVFSKQPNRIVSFYQNDITPSFLWVAGSGVVGQ